MIQIDKIIGQLVKAMRLMAMLIAVLSLTSVSAWSALTVELVNGYNLVVDSNVTSPATYAPQSAYIGAKICNTGATTLNNVFVYVGSYNGGSGNTPGIYPVLNSNAQSSAWNTAHPQLVNTGNYSLTHVGKCGRCHPLHRHTCCRVNAVWNTG